MRLEGGAHQLLEPGADRSGCELEVTGQPLIKGGLDIFREIAPVGMPVVGGNDVLFNELVVIEDLYQFMSAFYPEFLTDIGMRHVVSFLVKLDVVVGVHHRLFPLRYFKGFRR